MDKIKKEIETYFPFVDKPRGIKLSFHKEDCHQCEDLREDLKDFKGQQLPPKTIRYIHQELSCLSAEGWCWVLPSFLRYGLTEEAIYNQFEIQFLIYNLGPDQKYEEETKQRLSKLSSNQINCLISFLNWCNEQEAWGDYIPESIEKAIKFLNKIVT